MAPNDLQKQFTAFLTTTLEKYRDQMSDNIFRSNVVLNELLENGNVQRQDGGSEIVQPLLYGRNSTIQSYQDYEELETEPQDGITAAEYDWKQIAGTIMISRGERRKNSGKEQLMNLFDKKIQQAEMTIQEEVNNQLINAFSAGNSGKDLTPIPQYIQKDPSTNETVGDINQQDNDWWRNQSQASTASTAKEFKAELYSLYNACTRGATRSKPDLAISDQATFEEYELALDDQKQYVDTDMADMGFENLRLKGARMVWDEVVPDVQNQSKFDIDSDYDEGSNPATGSVFFVTTDFLEFFIDSETEFVNTEFEKPVNQDAFVSQLLFMGELTVNNRRKHGVLYDIDRNLS